MSPRVAAFLKNVWAKEPVLVASFAIVGLAVILPTLNDGNMPDVPSHPQDPQGLSLEWLKRL
ncbi:hypothetical protein FD755_016650 [Muntiacus reevesi]|uniref:NADH dehydrogenase [ubiquinone] 1 alpha subcomplex subunit 3 n=2 Tax=Muntiacus TaxID=9885 RepID=A0A5N3XEN4_MUNRE|nr:hypothetical protein FD754_004657 [Muntiacus muntjak]KAB0371712.1 hypothetical protein FD755_016650 [Muntiacus reevesi]